MEFGIPFFTSVTSEHELCLEVWTYGLPPTLQNRYTGDYYCCDVLNLARDTLNVLKFTPVWQQD